MFTVPILLDVPSTADVIPDNAVAMLGILVPIVAIVFGIGVAVVWMYLDYRRKRELYQLYHAERMAAIDKGIELPPLPADFFKSNRARDPAAVRYRRRGLVLLLIGVAVGLALLGSGERESALWALVPAGWGLALLVSSRLEAKEKTEALGAGGGSRDRSAPNPPSP